MYDYNRHNFVLNNNFYFFRFSITVINTEHLLIAKLEGWPDIKMRSDIQQLMSKY